MRAMPQRTVFFVSDGTGITAETFGNSILAQFAAKPRHVRKPFVDSAEKATEVVAEINATALREGKRPIVFITLVNPQTRQIVKTQSSSRWINRSSPAHVKSESAEISPHVRRIERIAVPFVFLRELEQTYVNGGRPHINH